MTTKTLFLFVHGWGTDSYVWNGIDTVIAKGCEHRSIDLPGHGGLEQWDEETLAPALREIEKSTNAKRVGGIIGVGWSLGAMALLQAAAKKPGLFKALVLVGAGASFVKREGYGFGQPPARVKVMIKGMRATPFETVQRFYSLGFTQPELEDADVKEFLKRYSPPGPILCTEPGDGRPPGCYPKFDYAQIASALCALYAIDLREAVSGIATPTLIVHGTDDTVCRVEAGRALHALMLNSRIEEFKGCGHAPFLTARQRFIKSVLDFLSDL